MTRELIFDMETMGQDTSKCVMLDCAYYTFDRDRFTSDKPYTFEELVRDIQYRKVSVVDQVNNYGYVVDKSTVEWWSKREPEVRRRILPKPTDVLLRTFFIDMMDYIGNGKGLDRFWTRSNTFDPVILWRIASSLEEEKLHNKRLPFWAVRDVRTYIDAMTDFKKHMNNFIPISDTEKWNKMFEQHNCVHDVAADVLRLQTLARVNEDLSV